MGLFSQLSTLRVEPRCALLLSVVGSFNKGHTENGSARHFPKFCSISLRKTSYIPNVSQNAARSARGFSYTLSVVFWLTAAGFACVRLCLLAKARATSSNTGYTPFFKTSYNLRPLGDILLDKNFL